MHRTVYEHYKNKEALLTSCFLTIDDEIARKIANAPEKPICRSKGSAEL